MNEADTSRRFVVPKLQAAGWETEPQQGIDAELDRLMPTILDRAFKGEL